MQLYWRLIAASRPRSAPTLSSVSTLDDSGVSGGGGKLSGSSAGRQAAKRSRPGGRLSTGAECNRGGRGWSCLWS